MLNPLGVLSLQLACQFLSSKNYSSLIGVYNTNTLVVKSAEELPAGYTAFSDIGVAYKLHKPNPRVSWNAARKYCETEGGDLATIDSSKKIEYLKGIGLEDDGVWVGIHRFFGDAEWTSIKYGLLGTPLPWRSSSYRTYGGIYQCGAVIAGSGVGLFVSICKDPRNFICEISISRDGRFMLTRSPQLN